MKKVEKLVCDLIGRYKTSSPFKLCKKMGIGIYVGDLPSTTRGFFYKENENSNIIILLNNNLNGELLNLVCAHELGHALMHGDINCVREENNGMFNLEQLEDEADYFAYYLINEQNCEDNA